MRFVPGNKEAWNYVMCRKIVELERTEPVAAR